VRYQVRQKIFSFGDNFIIKNEFGDDIFRVRGRIFSLGNKLIIEDIAGHELVYIEQRLFKFLPQYTIYMNEMDVATIKKEISFFKPRFHIESIMGNYEMEGDIFSHEFSILKGGRVVAMVSKQWFSFSDTYGVEIDNNEDQAFIMALVIVIDQVLYDNKDR
jgi:uncharacterized protein YxjI